MVLGASQTWTTNPSTQLTVSGNVSDGSNGYGLTSAGGGELVLSGSNTYSGGTTVSSGTLLVSNTTAGGSATGTGSVDGQQRGDHRRLRHELGPGLQHRQHGYVDRPGQRPGGYELTDGSEHVAGSDADRYKWNLDHRQCEPDLQS